MKTIGIVILGLALLAVGPTQAQTVHHHDDPGSPPAGCEALREAAADLVRHSAEAYRAALYGVLYAGSGPHPSNHAYHLVRALFFFHGNARLLSGQLRGACDRLAPARRTLARLERFAARVDAILADPHGAPVRPTDHGSTVAEAWAGTREALAKVRDLLGSGETPAPPPPPDPHP